MSKNALGRDYFKDDVREPRATQLHLLSHEERANIPTENLVAEPYLAKFGYLASISASRSNKFFKAKRTRDDLMFTVGGEGETTKAATNHIIKALEHLEVEWTDEQKKKWKEKISKNIKKKAHQEIYKDILLMKCKDHGGPITSVDELNLLLTGRTGDDLRKCLHQEVGLRKAMRPFDAKEQPALYTMNFLKSEQLIENFMILLNSTGSENEGEPVLFPSDTFRHTSSV